METILVAVLAFIVISVLVIGLLAWKKPAILEPVAKLLMKVKWIRDRTNKMTAEKMAENPEMFEDLVSEQLGREQARKVSSIMTSKSAEGRQELLEKAARGEEITLEDFSKEKTPDQQRAAKLKHQKARAKSKAAAKARKKQRKRK